MPASISEPNRKNRHSRVIMDWHAQMASFALRAITPQCAAQFEAHP
jgi:hypothetical protein